MIGGNSNYCAPGVKYNNTVGTCFNEKQIKTFGFEYNNKYDDEINLNKPIKEIYKELTTKIAHKIPCINDLCIANTNIIQNSEINQTRRRD